LAAFKHPFIAKPLGIYLQNCDGLPFHLVSLQNQESDIQPPVPFFVLETNLQLFSNKQVVDQVFVASILGEFRGECSPPVILLLERAEDQSRRFYTIPISSPEEID